MVAVAVGAVRYFLIIRLARPAWRPWPSSSPHTAGAPTTRGDYIARKYQESCFTHPAHRKHVHRIPPGLAGTPKHHPEHQFAVQCPTEDDIPPNRPGCNAHPGNPFCCRGGSCQRRRIEVAGPSPRSPSTMFPASQTKPHRYRSNLRKYSGEDVTVSFKPCLGTKLLMLDPEVT